jgi:hypothetical protein
VGAAPGGNERRRRKNKTKTLKTKLLLCLNYSTNKKLENPNFWGFFLVIIEGYMHFAATNIKKILPHPTISRGCSQV